MADQEKYNCKSGEIQLEIRRNTFNRWSLSSRNYPCRRGVEVVVSNSNMQAAARLGQVNMQNASKQKKILAEGRKLMKDEDSFLREERGKWETCKMWWWTQTGTFLMSVIEQGWSVDGKIGQCKQSSRQPLCLERNMVGAGHSSQLRATGALSCMQGYPRGG